MPTISVAINQLDNLKNPEDVVITYIVTATDNPTWKDTKNLKKEFSKFEKAVEYAKHMIYNTDIFSETVYIAIEKNIIDARHGNTEISHEIIYNTKVILNETVKPPKVSYDVVRCYKDGHLPPYTTVSFMCYEDAYTNYAKNAYFNIDPNISKMFVIKTTYNSELPILINSTEIKNST